MMICPGKCESSRSFSSARMMSCACRQLVCLRGEGTIKHNANITTWSSWGYTLFAHYNGRGECFVCKLKVQTYHRKQRKITCTRHRYRKTNGHCLPKKMYCSSKPFHIIFFKWDPIKPSKTYACIAGLLAPDGPMKVLLSLLLKWPWNLRWSRQPCEWKC